MGFRRKNSGARGVGGIEQVSKARGRCRFRPVPLGILGLPQQAAGRPVSRLCLAQLPKSLPKWRSTTRKPVGRPSRAKDKVLEGRFDGSAARQTHCAPAHGTKWTAGRSAPHGRNTSGQKSRVGRTSVRGVETRASPLYHFTPYWHHLSPFQ